MYKLVFKDGEKVTSYPFQVGEVRIGRASDNDLVINDFGVSRHHAKVVVDNGQCFIVDLESRNGTRVNNVLVTKRPLNDGDEISLGKFTIRYSKGTDDQVHLEEEKEESLSSPGTFIRPISDIRKIIPENVASVATAPVGEVGAIREIQKSNQILQVLIAVAKSLLTVQPLDEVLNLVMNLIFDHLPAERGFLMLYDDDTRELTPKVVKYRTQSGDSPKITISRTITNKVFQDKVSILTSDAQMDPRFDGGASIIFHSIRSAMCAPLWNKDDVIGVVFIDSSTRSGSFMPEDLDLFTALANYAAIGIEQARLNEKIKEEIKRRSQLERYHSPAVVNRILSFKGTDSSIDAQEMDVTVLFSDIVGFTSLSEKMEPHRVSLMLNDYFTEMTDIIFSHDGTLDKFIGDAIMAIFGAPIPMEDHAVRAVKTALEMKKRLQLLNEEKFSSIPLNIRIGINSGRVVAGDIGSPKRIEYTVLGNTVNVASRLESSIAKPGQVVVGENTYELIKDKFEVAPLGASQIRGLVQSLMVYEVLREKEEKKEA
jgi:adenylate cyclase